MIPTFFEFNIRLSLRNTQPDEPQYISADVDESIVLQI